MGLTIVRWIDTSFMIILYTAICIGELTLRPETVPFENESWELICKADPLSGTVTFNNPLGTVIGFCVTLTESCSPNPGYALAINVTEKTVTMTRTLTSNDNGTWTCSNSGDSKTYVLQSPLLSRNVPQSKTDYFEHSMTALPGITIDTTEADYQFTFNYGCVSANLKFQWTILPGDSWDDTLNTASTALSCSTNQAFKSTKPTSEILSRVTQDGSKLKVSVYVDGYYNLQAVKEYTFNVTFSPSSNEGGGGSKGMVIALIIISIILTLSVIVVIFCILFNRRCRSRYLRKKSKFTFTCPNKDITVIDNDFDNDFELERVEGLAIEIQCLRTEKGKYVHGNKPLHEDKSVRVRNNPCILLNTYFEIDTLTKENVGVYKYERPSTTENCSLTLTICPDLIITDTSIIHWACKGDFIGLQLEKPSSDSHWIKTSFKNEKVFKTTRISTENRLVLKNISDKDAGSYHAENAKEKWTSGCLTLKIVNYRVTVGKKDDVHVAVVRNSIKLKFTECKLSSIQCLKWKKSELIDETKIRELESSSNFEVILGEMTKEDEGLYWCEVLNKDGTSSKSGKLTLQVVNAIVNVGMKSASCSATIGDSIQIRWTKKVIPQHIKFTVKQNKTNRIAPQTQIKSITNNAYLLIGKISTEDEGCYQFESADTKSGVLTLSAVEGKENNRTFYKGKSGLPTLQPRKGAKTTLDSIPDISKDKKKKKKKKRNKNETIDEMMGKNQIAHETKPEKNEIE